MLSHPVETERLIIRHFEPRDWEEVYRYTAMPDVMTYIPEGTFTEIQAKEFVQENGGEQSAAYATVLAHSQEVIGHIIFHPWFAERTYEIGWVFHPAYHGRGYATEAARAVLAYGFESLRLHRIIATCQPENVASYRVMEKLGMRQEGFFRKCIYLGEDAWWDEYFYAMLEEEWPGKVAS